MGILAAKALIAVMLLVAGGAKFADLASFAAAVRLLAPVPVPARLFRLTALAIAAAELGLGAASLALPEFGWLNPPVFALACGFLAVSAAGWAFHRGRSCRCFGSLSNRKFDLAGIARAAVIAGGAALACAGVPPALVSVSGPARALLLATGGLTAAAAFSAARALGLARRLEPEGL